MRKRINKYIIPNIATLSSLFAGFLSIIVSGYGETKLAAYLIILGAFFDSMDGLIARSLKATSDFGREIDSLSDLITFGLAPGYLVFQSSLYKFGNFGIITAGLIPISAALRLARFNLRPTYKFFEGLPSTSAGLTIAVFQGFFQYYFSPYFYLVLSIIISFLMVSSVKYYKINFNKLYNLIKKKNLFFLILLLIPIFLFKWVLAALIFSYIFSGPVNTILTKKYRKKIENINI